jgi:tetratricopeptide (TPR) repeat protein
MVRTSTAVAPRYARWLELNGRSREAMTLLEHFRASLDSGFRVPPEQLAWTDLRLGDLAAKNGRADLARQAYKRGLSLMPEDPRLLAGIARAAAVEGDWAVAIDAGERATGQLLDPATLGLVSDAWAACGDTARAAEYARAMEVATSRQAGGYHRAWSLFLLDHGRRVPEVIARARAELVTRQDVYGDDLLAWALHRDGRDTEAWPHAQRALLRGTRDGLLHYHVGMIALGIADTARARAELDSALAINPRFHPFQADSARRLRRRLGEAE